MAREYKGMRISAPEWSGFVRKYVTALEDENAELRAELGRVRGANKKMCSYDYIDKVERELTEARDEVARLRGDAEKLSLIKAALEKACKTAGEETNGPVGRVFSDVVSEFLAAVIRITAPPHGLMDPTAAQGKDGE